MQTAIVRLAYRQYIDATAKAPEEPAVPNTSVVDRPAEPRLTTSL